MNRMKYFYCTIILIQSLISGFSQSPFPTVKNIDAFINSVTCIVMDNNPFSGYNIYIKDAIVNHWKLTEYKFIDSEQFIEARKDSSLSFLLLTKINFEKDKEMAEYNFLNLLMGGDYLTITDMPEFASVPLSYSGVDENRYVYKLGLIVSFLQDHVRFMVDNSDKKTLQDLRFYNKYVPQIKNYTLLIAEGDLTPEVNTIEKIKEIYPYEMEIVSHSRIEKAITDKEENVVFLHKVGPEETSFNARCYKVIMGAADGKIYFSNFHNINTKRPEGFLERDFKRIARF